MLFKKIIHEIKINVFQFLENIKNQLKQLQRLRYHDKLISNHLKTGKDFL